MIFAGEELRPGSNLLRPHPGLPRLCALQAAPGGRPHPPHEAAEEATQGGPAISRKHRSGVWALVFSLTKQQQRPLRLSQQV